MFFIHDNIIHNGQNTIKISTKSKIDGIFSLSLAKDNKISPINTYSIINDEIIINLNINNNAVYKIIIRDDNEIIHLPLSYINHDGVAIEYNFTTSMTYGKNIIKMYITSDRLVKKGYTLNITGDLNKKITWNSNNKSISVDFIKLIVGSQILNFKINDQAFSETVIDVEKLPTDLIKTNNGLKLNKACSEILKIVTNTDVIYTSPKFVEIAYKWEGVQEFKVYLQDKLLFVQKIKISKNKPELIISTNPLRFKVGYSIQTPIEIKIKGIESKFILEAGKKELLFNINKTGLVDIEIEKATNVVLNQHIWKFIL